MTEPLAPEQERAARIAARNDAFRKTANTTVLFSRTLADEGPATLLELLQRVRAFDGFTPANDPYGEHDYGSFTHRLCIGAEPSEQTVLWKIDTYADASLTYGADDPLANEAVRVLTIMHVSDY
jgi:hypothetical protein